MKDLADSTRSSFEVLEGLKATVKAKGLLGPNP